jgi:hypothetical protein
MDDIEFDSLVDWSGLGPGPFGVNDPELNNFSHLGQVAFGSSAQDCGLPQNSAASALYSHQSPLNALQLNSAHGAQQPSVQEPTTFLSCASHETVIPLTVGTYAWCSQLVSC